MTEENTEPMTFGSQVGQVRIFFNRKGYGFIRDLSDNQDYFVHNTEIKTEPGIYRKLYPGEYVSFSLVDKEGKQVCSEVRGIQGGKLLTETSDYTYRVYPKQDSRPHTIDYDITSDSEDDSDDDGGDDDATLDEPKEFINKVAPEGIEVAEFDGLNINEEMG